MVYWGKVFTFDSTVLEFLVEQTRRKRFRNKKPLQRLGKQSLEGERYGDLDRLAAQNEWEVRAGDGSRRLAHVGYFSDLLSSSDSLED